MNEESYEKAKYIREISFEGYELPKELWEAAAEGRVKVFGLGDNMYSAVECPDLATAYKFNQLIYRMEDKRETFTSPLNYIIGTDGRVTLGDGDQMGVLLPREMDLASIFTVFFPVPHNVTLDNREIRYAEISQFLAAMHLEINRIAKGNAHLIRCIRR